MSDRLISADELIERAYRLRLDDREQIVQMIESAPTVDAIPVVWCKDCKYRDPEDYKCDSGSLERMGCVFPVADDYFCACGKRREP